MKSFGIFIVLIFLTAKAPGSELCRAYQAEGSYVVVMSRNTAGLSDWRKAADALRAKYDADMIIYDSQVEDCLPALARLQPNYVCFVLQPAEAGRKTVVAIHRFTRRMDEDLYTDTIWSILTGYTAEDALRIAEHKTPLLIDSAASSMGPSVFENLKSGFASSETDKSKFWMKTEGGETREETVNPDPVESLAQAFKINPPDLFVTSGHATENDWQIGYGIRAGEFRHDKGQLYGLNTQGKRFDITSPAPKVYMPMGNCLIGHIDKPECMATAWMHTGGAYQMFGYVAVTFHGYMGWGIGKYFANADVTLAEAFYFNLQALLHEIKSQYPEHAHRHIEPLEQQTLRRMAGMTGITDRTIIGHLWDKDAVAFYGDPAWIAKQQDRDRLYSWNVTRNAEAFEVTIEILRDARLDRPLIVPLKERVTNIKPGTCTADQQPVFADNFVLIPAPKDQLEKGQKIRITFGAKLQTIHKTSAGSEPIILPSAQADGQKMPEKTETGSLQEQKPAPGIKTLIALDAAGDNGKELREALELTSDNRDRYACMTFLIDNMPLTDLQSLKSGFLINTVDYALKAKKETPWGQTLSDEMFLCNVLPYASLNERRDDWRPDFYRRFMPVIADCKTAGEAAIRLNKTIFDTLNVHYHATKRPKADQSPYESIEASYASCTGLSILLTDACRAVGVPARVAGVAEWTGAPGNHTWVEVWDGRWHAIGASESTELGSAWFTGAAARVDESDPMKRIYASSFIRSPLRFPLVWAPYVDYVSAVDVTARYKKL